MSIPELTQTAVCGVVLEADCRVNSTPWELCAMDLYINLYTNLVKWSRILCNLPLYKNISL